MERKHFSVSSAWIASASKDTGNFHAHHRGPVAVKWFFGTINRAKGPCFVCSRRRDCSTPNILGPRSPATHFHRLPRFQNGLEKWDSQKRKGQQVFATVLLAQIVVDPIDSAIRLRERWQEGIPNSRAERKKIVSEGLLEDHPQPSRGFFQQGRPWAKRRFDRFPETGRRWQGQVKGQRFFPEEYGRVPTCRMYFAPVSHNLRLRPRPTDLVMQIFLTPPTQNSGALRATEFVSGLSYAPKPKRFLRFISGCAAPRMSGIFVSPISPYVRKGERARANSLRLVKSPVAPRMTKRLRFRQTRP
jgi:hypothetical protein